MTSTGGAGACRSTCSRPTTRSRRSSRDAFLAFFTENALGGKRAFHGLEQMEDDIVAMGLSLFHAPDDAAGFFTTGGSESIICARSWRAATLVRHQYRQSPTGAATSCAAVFRTSGVHQSGAADGPRACDASRWRRIAVPTSVAMARAIDAETMMLVGSAPCFSYGTIDPGAELGQLAQERGRLAARRRLRRRISRAVRGQGGYTQCRRFDFAVPGVTSLSADLHKFGFCPKPASTVFYRSADRRQRASRSRCDDWPGGKFATATLVGTRPGGAVAGAWATLQCMGEQGLRRRPHGRSWNLPARIGTASRRSALRVDRRPGLVDPVLRSSDEFDMLRVERGDGYARLAAGPGARACARCI